MSVTHLKMSKIKAGLMADRQAGGALPVTRPAEQSSKTVGAPARCPLVPVLSFRGASGRGVRSLKCKICIQS